MKPVCSAAPPRAPLTPEARDAQLTMYSVIAALSDLEQGIEEASGLILLASQHIDTRSGVPPCGDESQRPVYGPVKVQSLADGAINRLINPLRELHGGIETLQRQAAAARGRDTE